MEPHILHRVEKVLSSVATGFPPGRGEKGGGHTLYQLWAFHETNLSLPRCYKPSTSCHRRSSPPPSVCGNRTTIPPPAQGSAGRRIGTPFMMSPRHSLRGPRVPQKGRSVPSCKSMLNGLCRRSMRRMEACRHSTRNRTGVLHHLGLAVNLCLSLEVWRRNALHLHVRSVLSLAPVDMWAHWDGHTNRGVCRGKKALWNTDDATDCAPARACGRSCYVLVST